MGSFKRKMMNLVKEQELPGSLYIVMAAVAISLFTFGCNDFCGFQSAKERGTWQEFHGIFTGVEPADLELYRELLPAEMEMPERPAVGVFIVDYVIVVPCPHIPYLEGTLGIRGIYNGEEGWHTVTMPLSNDAVAALFGGRSVGFPKYPADVTLTQSGDNWQGVVTHEGVVRMSLNFTPGFTRELEPWEEEEMNSGLTRLEVPIFQKGPIEDLSVEGADLYHITLFDKVPATWESTQGMVEIHISPDDPWAGLIEPGTVSPGLFQEFTGGKEMDAEKVN